MNGVRFLFFAQASDWAKTSALDIFLKHPQILSELMNQDTRFSMIAQRKSFLKVAVNQELANFEAEVKNGDEVAILPPFSGG